MRVGASIAALAALLAAAVPARAAGNDFRLNATHPKTDEGILFSKPVGREDFVVNEAVWKGLVNELGYVFAPRMASPAETLGHSGYHVSAMWSGTLVSNEEAYWHVTEKAQATGSPNGLMQTLQLDVRKGLPMSFEVGVNLMWLVDSSLFAPGIEVRWALHEGFDMAPDLAVRGSVNHLVGNRDLNLTVIGLDAVISRSFGVGGVANLAPYLSWSLLFVAASSRVLDPTPTDESDVGRNIVLPELSASNQLQQKLTVGLRVLFSILNISVQGEFQFLKDTPTGVEAFGPVATVTTKLGLDY